MNKTKNEQQKPSDNNGLLIALITFLFIPSETVKLCGRIVCVVMSTSIDSK